MEEKDQKSDLFQKFLPKEEEESKEHDYQFARSLPKVRAPKPEVHKLPSCAKVLPAPKQATYAIEFPSHAYAMRRRSVRSFSGREKEIAKRNLQLLSSEMQDWIYAHVHQEVKVVGKEEVPEYTLNRRMEERQFQIDRIIKYLSQP